MVGVKDVITNPEETSQYERVESTMSQITGSTDSNNKPPVDELMKRENSSGSENFTSGTSSNDAEIAYNDDEPLEKLNLLQRARNLAKEFVAHPVFDTSIFLVIIVSSVLMAMADYGSVDNENNLVATGSPIDTTGSAINRIIIESEPIFVAIFTFEFAVKSFALGLFGEGSYFWDSWNWLDFVVVFFALFSYYPGVPNVSVFRIFRVLRPLKSVKSFPALAAIVQVMLQSIVLMRDIFIVVIFLFLVFGIAGLQLFGGPYMHTRCRYTPYPVLASYSVDFYANLSATNLSSMPDFTPYRCADVPNFDLAVEDFSITKRTSPWHKPRPECFWPIDPSDDSFCDLANGGLGNYICDLGDSGRTLYCGSNYDALGNPRFNPGTADEETFVQNLGYSYLNFDNLGMAFLTTFQIMAGDGWSNIMYLMGKASEPMTAAIFCVLLIMLGTFFILQLIIATLENTLVSTEDAGISIANYRANRTRD